MEGKDQTSQEKRDQKQAAKNKGKEEDEASDEEVLVQPVVPSLKPQTPAPEPRVISRAEVDSNHLVRAQQVREDA